MPLFGRPDSTPTIDYFDNMGLINASSAVATNAIVYNTLVIQPMTPFNEVFPGNMTVSTAMLNVSHPALTATASSSSFSSSMMIGVYTLANSTQLSLMNSAQFTMSRAAATANTTVFSGGGMRWVTIHSSQWSASPTFSAGRYWLGVIARSSNFNFQGSSVGMWMLHNFQRFGTLGSSVVTNSSMAHYPFLGILSVSTSALPVSIGASAMNKTHNSYANWVPHLVFNNQASAF